MNTVISVIKGDHGKAPKSTQSTTTATSAKSAAQKAAELKERERAKAMLELEGFSPLNADRASRLLNGGSGVELLGDLMRVARKSSADPEGFAIQMFRESYQTAYEALRLMERGLTADQIRTLQSTDKYLTSNSWTHKYLKLGFKPDQATTLTQLPVSTMEISNFVELGMSHEAITKEVSKDPEQLPYDFGWMKELKDGGVNDELIFALYRKSEHSVAPTWVIAQKQAGRTDEQILAAIPKPLLTKAA